MGAALRNSYMTAKERMSPHPSDDQTNNARPKHVRTHGESSYCYSLIVTSSSFNPSATGRFTDSAFEPGNGKTLQTQTYSLNGQVHNGLATTDKEGHSTNSPKTESECQKTQ
jgi:hypothetical protein